MQRPRMQVVAKPVEQRGIDLFDTSHKVLQDRFGISCDALEQARDTLPYLPIVAGRDADI